MMKKLILLALLGIICGAFTMTGCLTTEDDYEGSSGACYYNNGLYSVCRDNVSSPSACEDLHVRQDNNWQFIENGHCN